MERETWEDCVSSSQKPGAVKISSNVCLAAHSPKDLFVLPEIAVEGWVIICSRHFHEASVSYLPLWNCSDDPHPPYHWNKGSHYVAFATSLQMNHFVNDKITDSIAKYSPEHLASTSQSQCTRSLLWFLCHCTVRCCYFSRNSQSDLNVFCEAAWSLQLIL